MEASAIAKQETVSLSLLSKCDVVLASGASIGSNNQMIQELSNKIDNLRHDFNAFVRLRAMCFKSKGRAQSPTRPSPVWP